MITNPIYNLLDDKTFTVLHDAGLLNDTALMRLRIKREYPRIRGETGSSTQAKFKLAEEYHRSTDVIRRAIYENKELDRLLLLKRTRRSRNNRRVNPDQLSLAWENKGGADVKH